MDCDWERRSILYRLTSIWNFHLLSFKSSGSAATQQVNSACCSDGKLHLETCLFSLCASNMNTATTGSLDLIQKKKTPKQRSRAHWKMTAFSYLTLGKVWNQSLKQSARSFLTPVTFFSRDSMKLSTEIKPIWIDFASPPHQWTLGAESKYLQIY